MADLKEAETIRPEAVLLYLTPPKDDNLSFVLPQILVEKGIPISISEFEEGHFVKVYASLVGKSILEKLEEIPEIDAINGALSGTVVSEIDIEDCNWDESTKIRVEAFSWQSRADFFQKMAESVNPTRSTHARQRKQEDEEEAQKAQTKAKELLKDLPPFTPSDIHSLLEEVVDRVLAQTPKS